MATRRAFSFALVLSLLVVLVAISTTASAQEVTASIVGTVTDPSNAPIGGADVTATDADRGTVWAAKTNDAGSYNIARLPVGNYSVKVVASGFQTATYPKFTLVLNQSAHVDVQMKVGQVSESVEVTGAAPLLQTESTEVSSLIDSHTVTELPLAARNYVQLTLLSPGATHVNPSSLQQPQNMIGAGRPYINGNREQANLFLLDGQVNGEKKNDEVGYNPSVDAIQEFNLITQNASAEFGNYQGGVINASIKSGTNSYHGDVFEFFRSDYLNANTWEAGTTRGILNGVLGHSANGVAVKPEMRYNIFGGTFGGPIIKNKLFFFADYQGTRRLVAGTTGTQLLTGAERNGDFGQICTQFGGTFNGSGICAGGIQLVDPNNSNAPIPFNNFANTSNAINPVVANLLSSGKYPTPQVDTAVANNYFFKSGNNLNNDQGDLKLDYHPGSKDAVFFRWSQMDLRNPGFSNLAIASAGSGSNNDDPVRNTVLNWSHTFGPTLLNEARVGFSAVHYTQSGTTADVLGNLGAAIGIAHANDGGPGLVQMQIGGVGPGTDDSLGNIAAVQIFHTTEGQAEDNVIISRARHSLKLGFQYWRERQDYDYGGNNGQLGFLSISTLTGAAPADFWMGNVGGGFRDGNTNTLFGLRANVFGGYVQDDWRATNNLTVNLGIRFEDHTPFYEIHDDYVNFGLFNGLIYTPNGVAGTTKFGNRSLKNNYLGIGDWLPRVGFSWRPSALGGKTVIRAGYGISEYMEGSGANEELTQNPPFFGATESANSGIGAIALGFQGAGSVSPCAPFADFSFSCYAGKRIRVFDQNFRPTLTQQWNLTIQHQLSNTVTFQIGYVGQHGTHLLNFFDATQLMGLNAAGQIARPGQQIVTRVAGPFLGGGAPGSLYSADNSLLGGANAIAGTNMSNSDQRYDALQAVLQKRMSNGLQGQVAYTYSKCLSNSPGYFGTGWGSTQATSSGGQPGWQNSYDPHADWGPCYWDQTHILSSYVVYQLPVGHGKQFGHDMNPALNAVLGNWEIGAIVTLHTGNALTLNEFGGWGAFNGDPSNTNSIGNYFLSARPNCTGSLHNVNQKVPGDPATGTPGYIQWFDSTGVSHPSNEFGTCSVGSGRGPSLANVDLSLHKDFVVAEGKILSFRLEGINTFNHPIHTFAGGPASGSFDLGSPNFGQFVGSQGERNLQLGLKFLF